ncbi:hypothetical protein L9F63_023593 [Diploptera punctata]|uniref:Uncharacterized protein n=1 Tax=Diploptera punctata TaxID=6984 RepID=A0AAD7ZIT4_DIPPU|nr:hypothetical protein L9F63_023593 [Diploptera punctata]
MSFICQCERSALCLRWTTFSREMTLAVERCCCGCSVRVGTIIIAIYILTCSLLLTVFGCLFLGVFLYKDNEEFYKETKEQIKKGDIVVTLVTTVIGGLIQVILNIVLLVGVKKESTCLVLVWLVSNIVLLVISFLMLIMSFFQSPTLPQYQVATVLTIALMLYFLLVVKSFYHTIQSTNMKEVNMAYDIENENKKRKKSFD